LVVAHAAPIEAQHPLGTLDASTRIIDTFSTGTDGAGRTHQFVTRVSNTLGVVAHLSGRAGEVETWIVDTATISANPARGTGYVLTPVRGARTIDTHQVGGAVDRGTWFGITQTAATPLTWWADDVRTTSQAHPVPAKGIVGTCDPVTRIWNTAPINADLSLLGAPFGVTVSIDTDAARTGIAFVASDTHAAGFDTVSAEAKEPVVAKDGRTKILDAIPPNTALRIPWALVIDARFGAVSAETDRIPDTNGRLVDAAVTVIV